MAEYIRRKIKVLRQLGIEITDGEREQLIKSQTEIAADNIARSIIINCWEE